VNFLVLIVGFMPLPPSPKNNHHVFLVSNFPNLEILVGKNMKNIGINKKNIAKILRSQISKKNGYS
jgi:hypothetical protein